MEVVGGVALGKAWPGQPLPQPQPQPKSQELFRSQWKESKGSVDCPNLQFKYGDANGHGAKLAEPYSYTEEPELSTNRRCFEEDFHTQVQGRKWLELDRTQQKAYVICLLDGLLVVNRDKWLKGTQAIIYLAQGIFRDCGNKGDVLHCLGTTASSCTSWVPSPPSWSSSTLRSTTARPAAAP